MRDKILLFIFSIIFPLFIFNQISYNFVEKSEGIYIYKKIIAINYVKNSYTYITNYLLFDATKLGNTDKYFYGELKLNEGYFSFLEDDPYKDKFFWYYEDNNKLDKVVKEEKYILDKNKEKGYFIYNKETKEIKGFNKEEEFIKFLEENIEDYKLYPLWKFKLLETSRVLRMLKSDDLSYKNNELTSYQIGFLSNFMGWGF